MALVSLSAVIMFLAVALGAFGAHGLRETLEGAGRQTSWDAAVLYHLVHGLAFAVVALWRGLDRRALSSPWLTATLACWGAGILLFSGSLYPFAVGGPRWLVWLTPLGGMGFLAGWAALAVGAHRLRPSARGDFRAKDDSS